VKAKLVSKWGEIEGAEYEIADEATIGRGEDSTIRIEAKAVSSRHARIFFDNERKRYYVEDLGSLNGTELDGMTISRAEPLSRLHVLRFAGVAEFLFVEVDRTAAAPAAKSDAAAPAAKHDAAARAAKPDIAAPAAESEPTTHQTRVDNEAPELPAALREEPEGTRVEEAPVPLPGGLAELGAPGGVAGKSEDIELPQNYLLAVATTGETRRFELAEGENVVGRSLGAKIRLADRDLSRRHAVVTLEAGRVTVRDLGSRNKTFVAGEAIEAEVELQPEDVVLFGPVEARLLAQSAGDTLPPPLEGGKKKGKE